MDLTSHPAPFPPLKILRRFLALIASPSHCASVKPTWSLRKRCCHRAIGRGTEAREAPRAPSDLTIFPRVCHLLASPRLTPPTPVKTVVRTPPPVLRRSCRRGPHREGATGASSRLNSGEPQRAMHRPLLLDPSRLSPIGWWRLEDCIPFHFIKSRPQICRPTTGVHHVPVDRARRIGQPRHQLSRCIFPLENRSPSNSVPSISVVGPLH
jgi:hypothetical protein